jgi:transcriptional regulator with PAS, ATPase and Fis domain
VQQGAFREDLFYRLNVVNLTLPPLRERLGDVRVLSLEFMNKYSEKNQKKLSEYSAETLSMLESHVWPGNIRELENVIERAVITSQGNVIGVHDICIERREISGYIAESMAEKMEKNWVPGRTLDDIERNVILEALQYHQGNRTHTAKALGISIRTLRNKIADYRRLGIEV